MLRDKEPLLIKGLLFLIILEVPFFYLFLISPLILVLSLIFIYKRKVIFTNQMLVLSIFIITYFLFDTRIEASKMYKIWYILSVISIYIAGYCTKFEKKKDFFKIGNTIDFIAKSYIFYVGVSFIYSILKGQFLISRNPLNIWTATLRAATHYGTMLVIPVAYGIFLFLFIKEKKKNFIGKIFIIFSILFSIITASRTILYLIPIGYIAAYYYNIKILGKLSQRHKKQLLTIVIVVVLFFVLFFINAFGIQDLFFKSQLGQRYLSGKIDKFSEDGRTINILFLLMHLKESFFGGGYTRIHSGNLHNIYLNVYDLSGIIPFIFLIIFTFKLIKNLQKLFRRKCISNQDRILIFIFYLLAFIQLLLEPVMESVPVFCWCLLYISGMIEKSSLYKYKIKTM